MRVAEISLEYVGGSSGPAYSVPRLTLALRAAGVDATLVGLASSGARKQAEHLLPFTPSGALRRIGGCPELRAWIHGQAASGAVDLLHCHSVWYMPLLYAASASRKYGKPLVVSPRGTLSAWSFGHGSPLKRLSWLLTQRRALRQVAMFHATSDMERQEIRSMGFSQPVEVVPNGVDVPPAIERQDHELKTVLFLSRIHPKKGLEDLLSAWRDLAPLAPDWQLVIAGPLDSPYASRLVAHAADARLPRVRFAGEVLDGAKQAAMADADLFVLPTHSENFGMAVAEALASGLPAVVSQGAPWHDIEKRGAGWWPATGVGPLKHALVEAMSCPLPELRRMGRAAREWMIESFSWESVARRMSRAYSTLR